MQENRSGFNGLSVKDFPPKVDIYPLMLFYAVETYEELIRAQAHHIEKLQGKLNAFREVHATPDYYKARR